MTLDPTVITLVSMYRKLKVLAAVLALAVPVALMPACSSEQAGTERWATTENTNVDLDWDKVNEAYQLAEGPRGSREAHQRDLPGR